MKLRDRSARHAGVGSYSSRTRFWFTARGFLDKPLSLPVVSKRLVVPLPTSTGRMAA